MNAHSVVAATDDRVDLTLSAAAYEREWAMASWATLVPTGGALPANASPLHRMLHARMETSETIYRLVSRRRMHGWPFSSGSSRHDGAAGSPRPRR